LAATRTGRGTCSRARRGDRDDTGLGVQVGQGGVDRLIGGRARAVVAVIDHGEPRAIAGDLAAVMIGDHVPPELDRGAPGQGLGTVEAGGQGAADRVVGFADRLVGDEVTAARGRGARVGIVGNGGGVEARQGGG
jgi:hypothetical protein